MSTSEPRIVCFDLETLPDLLEILKVWPRVGDYPGLTLKASITSIISFGYKVIGEPETHCINAWDFPEWGPWRNNDEPLVRAAYEILKDADCVVTHNGKRFDWKFLQTRLMKYKLPPLPKLPHEDTCAVSKRSLFVFNNSLNTLAKFLTDEQKLENGGWDLWVRVWEKDPEAFKLMESYCKQDIVATEALYYRLRPFMTSIPNFNMFTPAGLQVDKVCPNCGSTRLGNHGVRLTKTRRYQRYMCKDCGTTCRTDAEDRAPRTL